jgi:hypothetical protein
MARITKDNYNELKSKDLENNYAKVWHVNEIREELLANTGGGGAVTSVEGLTGNIVFQTGASNITATAVSNDSSITFNYTVPYQEVIFTVEVDNESVRMIYSSVEGLEYTNTFSGSTTILIPTLSFACDAISVQLTVSKEFGIDSYVEVPYVVNTNPATGEVRVSVDRASNPVGGFDGVGIKSGLYVNLKFFNFALA